MVYKAMVFWNEKSDLSCSVDDRGPGWFGEILWCEEVIGIHVNPKHGETLTPRLKSNNKRFNEQVPE